MRWLSGLFVILGIAMFVNAGTATWPFDQTEHTQGFRLLDIAVGVAFLLVAWWIAWLDSAREPRRPPRRTGFRRGPRPR